MNVNTLKISAMLSVLRALPYSSGPPPWSASPGRRPLLRYLPGQYYGGDGKKLLPGLALKRPCFAARGANKPPTQEPACNSGILYKFLWFLSPGLLSGLPGSTTLSQQQHTRTIGSSFVGHFHLLPSFYGRDVHTGRRRRG